MTLKPYCPICHDPLDHDNKCWQVCPLAGMPQPPIHRGVFETDTYEVWSGDGSLVKVIVQERLVEP